MDCDTKKKIERLLNSIRIQLEQLYGPNLQGKCVMASDIIVLSLKLMGFLHAQAVEGWCVYDDASSCSNTPYDPHTWVEFSSCGQTYYLDVTADQFNYWMFPEHRFPKVICRVGLPFGMSHNKPLALA